VDHQDENPSLTYREVLAADLKAYRRGDKDEFIYLPGGIMYWRSLRPGGPRTYCCSLPVQDRTMPDDGWTHEQPCACRFCRKRSES
jgi:hypothetical protein